MNSNKNKKGDDHELCRICPSKLTKHELEDLYFTVLESNMRLRKTVNEQEEKIRRLSSQMQRKYSAQKVLQAEERNNCCVSTNIKVKQQKESLDKLRREHDKTARRIRNLNIKLSSENTSRTYTPSYSNATSKLIRYTPSTLKQHNMTANYKVSEDKSRCSPCALKPRSQSRTCTLTGKESTNNKRRESIGTLTEMLRDQKSSETQTESPCCNKTLLSTEFQTGLPSNKESLSAESQTEMPSNKTSPPVEIQTEMPREKILQLAGTQTELLRDHTAETQTELPRDDTSETSSIQTQTAQEKDGDNMRRGEVTSNQTQTAPENNNANKFYAIEYREETLCNENKCRTLMDELRQKINNLVEELAETHNKYSIRISRLEIEVQEYRNENMRMRLGHPNAEYETATCGSFTRLLLNNLRAAESYSADLKMQLAIERKKVNELLSLIRGAKMRHRIPKDVAVELDAKKSKMNLDQNDCTIHYYCDSDCPIANISSKHKCTGYNYCKRGQNSTCCRAHDSPLNSIDSADNNQNHPPDLQSQNASPGFTKYTTHFKETQNRSDIKKNCDTKNKDLLIPGARFKGLCNIYSNTTPNRSSAPDALFNERCVASNVNNKQDLTKSINVPDGNQDVLSISDKITHLVDHIGIPKVYEADSGKDLPDCNNLNKIENLPDGVQSLCVPEVRLNDNNRNLGDKNTISNCNNEQEEVYDDNLDQNNTGDNKQQFSPNRKMSLDAFESLNNPIMLVKSLNDINEEQSKTVGELVRQMNDSQRSMQTTLIKPKSDDDSKPNDPRDMTKDVTNMILPQDTTGLMRVRSTHTDDVIISNVKNTADYENNNNQQKSMQSLDKYGPINSSELRVPEIIPSLSTFSKTPHDDVPSQKADTVRIKPTAKERNQCVSQQIPGGEPSSGPYEKRCKAPNANIPAPVDTQDTNKVDPENDKNRCREATELVSKYNTVPRNISNVPTKDLDSILKETIPSPETLSSVTIKVEPKYQETSMNNIYAQTGGNTNLLKPFKTSDKSIQVKLKRPEKLEIRNDFKDTNTNTTPTQLEIATYRRNSGTLCFKTVPVSKRSQHCQCTEQFHCEGIKYKGTQTEREIEKASKNVQGTCTTGCSKCTRNFARKSMEIQKTGYAIVPEATSTYYSRNATPKNETQLANTVPGGLTNYNNNMTNKEEAVKDNAIPRLNDGGPYQHDNSWRLLSQTPEPTARMQERLDAIAEELLSVKRQLSEAGTTSVLLEATGRIQTNLENKPSDEVVSEFDAGRRYVLKPGMAMHTINENNTPKCVFVLHIGTVVLSDEAVLTSRGKSLALTWKFYDQDTNMTQMRAGRVVVFDFSTEYDLRLTDEFLNYMKHDELQIIICELGEPKKPIASCSLPLRDALLNTNRRADMSLALVAGPQLVYARQANHVASDNLDSSDEMGVLDLWCMLRAEGQFLPRINKAIAGDLRVQAPDILSDSKRERPIIEPESSKTESIKFPEEIRPADEGTTLRRWGSSTLRLPSKDLSKDRSMETRSGEVEDWPEVQDDQASFFSSAAGSKHRDSIGLKTATTAEVDNGLTSRYRASFSDHKRRPKTKQDAGPSRANKSTAVPYDADYPDGIIVNEVIAKIKTSDDMKRVLNRPSQHPVSILAQEADAPNQTVGTVPTFVNKLMPDDIFKNKKSDASQEPSVVLPRTSTNKRSDIINQKYQDIVNLYPRSNSHKIEGFRSDQSRKQVTIANHKRHSSLVNEKPEQDIPEEDEQIIEITVLWLALNEECEAMLNPRVQRVYVAYEFLGRSGADLETPVSLPKPKHYVDKCYFNFKKSFEIDKKDMPLLGQLARCRATSVSQMNKSPNDCVVFSVISEPPEDPLGLEICEDIGYAYLFLGDLLAYSNGSSGYTEVIPVRSRTGTSVCGVLAVRLDGLDVLRQSLALVDRMLNCTQDRQA